MTTRECMDTAYHDTTDEEEDQTTSSRVCASEGGSLTPAHPWVSPSLLSST